MGQLLQIDAQRAELLDPVLRLLHQLRESGYVEDRHLGTGWVGFSDGKRRDGAPRHEKAVKAVHANSCSLRQTRGCLDNCGAASSKKGTHCSGARPCVAWSSRISS